MYQNYPWWFSPRIQVRPGSPILPVPPSSQPPRTSSTSSCRWSFLLISSPLGVRMRGQRRHQLGMALGPERSFWSPWSLKTLQHQIWGMHATYMGKQHTLANNSQLHTFCFEKRSELLLTLWTQNRKSSQLLFKSFLAMSFVKTLSPKKTNISPPKPGVVLCPLKMPKSKFSSRGSSFATSFLGGRDCSNVGLDDATPTFPVPPGTELPPPAAAAGPVLPAGMDAHMGCRPGETCREKAMGGWILGWFCFDDFGGVSKEYVCGCLLIFGDMSKLQLV